MGSDQDKRTTGAEGLALSAAVVLDPRLADVWRSLWEAEAIGAAADDPRGAWLPAAAIGPLLRMAYLQGYADAAGSDDPDGLYRELGVRLPADAIPTGRRARRPPRGRARPGSSGT